MIQFHATRPHRPVVPGTPTRERLVSGVMGERPNNPRTKQVPFDSGVSQIHRGLHGDGLESNVPGDTGIPRLSTGPFLPNETRHSYPVHPSTSPVGNFGGRGRGSSGSCLVTISIVNSAIASSTLVDELVIVNGAHPRYDP